MRKTTLRTIVLALLAALLVAGTLYADGEAGSVNYYADCFDTVEYATLCKHVFDDAGLDVALADYADLAANILSYPYEEWVGYLMVSRAAMIVARYAEQKDNIPVAEAYMTAADSFIETGRGYGAPESATGVLEALSNSFWYLIDGSISKGLAFGRIVGDLWDIRRMVRYRPARGIADVPERPGELPHEHLAGTFERAVALENGCAVWDQFSIYAGLAVGYDKAHEDELAYEYALLAREIYTADEMVNEIIEDYEK